MIIDAHCHVGEGLEYSFSPEELLSQMDSNDVEKAVIVPTDKYFAVYNREGNNYVLSLAKKHPDRFLPMATANPWYGDKAIEELSRSFAKGAVGLYLHPFLQGFRITDKVVYLLIELAGELKKPVYFHTGTPISCMPYQLTELAMQFPQVNFIMGHMAYSDFWYEVENAANPVKNIFLETSVHCPSFIELMVRKIGADRIMYGSDAPKCFMDLEIEKIMKYVPENEDREHIFNKTIKKVFKELDNGN